MALRTAGMRSWMGMVPSRKNSFFDARFAVAIGMVEVGFHGHQVDDSAETSFGADRQLQSDDVAAENLFERFHGALKTGELAVHPGENEGARNVVLRAIVPNFFRGDLRADVGVNGDEGGIGGDKRRFRLGDERGIAGEIDKINFDFVGRAGRAGGSGGPFGMGETGLNRNLARDFFFVPVGSGAPFRNFSPARSHPRGEEQRRHQLRFPGAAVADNANVANVPGEIALHTNLLIYMNPVRPGSSGEGRPKGIGRGPAPGQLVEVGERGPFSGSRVVKRGEGETKNPLVRSPDEADASTGSLFRAMRGASHGRTAEMQRRERFRLGGRR